MTLVVRPGSTFKTATLPLGEKTSTWVSNPATLNSAFWRFFPVTTMKDVTIDENGKKTTISVEDQGGGAGSEFLKPILPCLDASCTRWGCCSGHNKASAHKSAGESD